MNILYILEFPFKGYAGGFGTYMKGVLGALPQTNNNFYIAYPEYDNNSVVEAASHIKKIPVRIKDNGNYRKNVKVFCKALDKDIKNIISRYNIDVVHVLYGWYVLCYLDCSKIISLGKKIVITVHNVPPQENSTSFKGDKVSSQISNFFMNGLRAIRSAVAINTLNSKVEIVVPCDLVKKRLRHYGCRNNIYVVHHGCDDFFIGNHKADSKDSTRFNVLCVGGFAPGKNQKLLVEVFKNLEEKSMYRVVLVGRPRVKKYFDYIQKRIIQNDLSDIMEIRSDCSDDDLKNLYSQADLYVQPSTDEGFCLTALDAASQGLRVIGSDVGEIANIARLSGGIVTKFNDEVSFRKAIVALSCTKRSSYTNVGIIEEYSWDKADSQLFDVYRMN